ncbi:MAG: glycosyltransferase [Candidatus Aminicenantes bacterium]|nr:glycosyltransferase [Candidatus Aminicenantes bacterium]
MLAPEPFFEPRGTPISVYFRIKALTELGHRTTLVTYPIGQAIALKNLKIVRAPNLLGIRKVRIGPSLTKVPLDALLLLQAGLEIISRPYDLVFSHEEAALLGVWLARIRRKPHVYDMHSSLPQQLENFQFTRSPVLISLFKRMERYILKNSQAVIVICRDLMAAVDALGYSHKAIQIENFLDFPAEEFPDEAIARKKREMAPGGQKIVLYAGNFEPYQGIPLLLRAARKVGEAAVFLLVGGSGRSLQEMRTLAAGLGILDRTVFVDKVPPSQIPIFIRLADVLVSPRISGTNTPLKIYSFLKSGKPLVATRLWTHTQVLNEQNAVLAEPEPGSLARGIELALTSEEARARARAAREWAEAEFSSARYFEKIGRVLALARTHHDR